MTKKLPQGRPAGSLSYPETMVRDMLDGEYRTTYDIVAKIYSMTGLPISYATVQRYLKRMAERGEIKHRKYGRMHVWAV